MNTAPGGRGEATPALDLAAIVVCTLAWGTTWFAITLQLGVVDPIVSIAYRFAIAAALLFAWCAARGESLALSAAAHRAAAFVGFFTFGLSYAFVYWAEERVLSAIVAVVFAALAFVNQISFLLFHRITPRGLGATALGVLGVAVISWEEIAQAEIGLVAWSGIGLAFAAVVCSSMGNVYSHKAQLHGARIAPLTAWSMLYGTLILAAFALVTGRAWTFEWSMGYVLSLLYLASVGSVLGFVLYYSLALRRGYTAASYISALTPLVAMAVSGLFESRSWGVQALAGAALVLAGQFLLLRRPEASAG